MNQKARFDELRRKIEKSFTAVLSSYDGRVVIAQIMSDCGLYRRDADPGKRAIALDLRDLTIRLDPKLWTLIDAEMLAQRIEPNKKSEETEDE